jgi:hypothetical protein
MLLSFDALKIAVLAGWLILSSWQRIIFSRALPPTVFLPLWSLECRRVSYWSVFLRKRQLVFQLPCGNIYKPGSDHKVVQRDQPI